MVVNLDLIITLEVSITTLPLLQPNSKWEATLRMPPTMARLVPTTAQTPRPMEDRLQLTTMIPPTKTMPIPSHPLRKYTI